MMTTPNARAVFSSSRTTQGAAFRWTLLAALAVPAGLFAQPMRPSGDLNANGTVDLSDVIYLAQYLFRGGPAPIPVVTSDPGDGNEAEPASFDSSFFKSIDVSRAARDQYGPLADAVATGDHLYDWKARVGRELKGLDLEQAVAAQYGPDFTLVAVGVHKFDWKAIRFADLDGVILPVMAIASDQFFDIDGVRHGLSSFESVLGTVQAWYNAHVEGKLRVLAPVIIPTSQSSTQWVALSTVTQDPAHRYDLLDAAIAAYESSLPKPPEDVRVVIAPYSGPSPDVWLGAASRGRYAVSPQRATSVSCPAAGPMSSECSDAAYAIGHELGHTFGLGHTCDEYPNHSRCSDSIMQTGKPPEAILLQREVCILLDTPFFQ
jgi:hypothetical protein